MKNRFFIKDGKILLWRLGGINSVKQKHFGKNGKHQPPERRGLWCFPYPFYDLFFVYHVWEGSLPKKFRHEIGTDRKDSDFFDKMTDEEAQQYHLEKDRLIKEKRKQIRPSKFWYSGIFYSHISYHGNVDYNKWWKWDDVISWSKIANKHLVSFDSYDKENFSFTPIRYTRDHLELFIPNF